MLAGGWTLVIGCAMMLAAGCAMTQSTLTDMTVGSHGVACRSNAGSYFLPKTIFRVGLTKRTTGGGTANERSYFELSYLAAMRRSDGTRPYCLDYLANISSDDEINVVKYTGRLAVGTGEPAQLAKAKEELGPLDPVLLDRITSLRQANLQFDPNLLRYVMSDAVDQSAYIAETLIKSIFLGVAGASATVRGAGLDKPDATTGIQRVAELDFDPFDPVQSAIVNELLKDFGFCILVAGATFDPSLATVQQYCDKPMWWVQKQPVFNRKLETARSHNDVKEVRGILYRPRMPYRVFLFIKSELAKAGGWRLRKAEIVTMENIAPVIAVGVDRTFFAQRKTALVFDLPTSTPSTHVAELGSCRAIRTPAVTATRPLTSTQPQPRCDLMRKAMITSSTPSARNNAATKAVSVRMPASGRKAR